MPQDQEQEALSAFLARHVKLYEPTSDDYERPPFAADIKEGKNDPIYNAHSYHTKVPPRSIIPYILHYTNPGDLVLDPFCGSGMIGVAAQMCADPPADILEEFPELRDRVGPRPCILNDLSPAACHIAYNYNTPVDVEALKAEFDRIKAAVKDEFEWLYGTEHYEPAVGPYDPVNVDVASRLSNPAVTGSMRRLMGCEESRWELLSKSEVEARLGYSVTELQGDAKSGNLHTALYSNWVCIPATIQYTVWSDVYRCEGFVTTEEHTGRMSTRGKQAGKPIVSKKRVARGCGNEIVLWDVSVDDPAGDVKEEFKCPMCQQNWTKYDLAYVRTTPVYVALKYKGHAGKEIRHYRRITQRERLRVTEIDQVEIKDWFPNDLIYPHRELLSMGVTKHGVIRISDFWTRRNLRALARLWAEASKCSDARLARATKFVLTSMFGRIARTTCYNFRRAGNKSLSGLLYISSITAEDNILRQLDTKLRQCLTAFAELGRLGVLLGDEQSVVINTSAANLKCIADNSVDYVFTDPPFGGNIFYSDASMLYEAWLGSATSEAEELVFHRRSKQQRLQDNRVFKELDDYAVGMRAAFAEFFRVLKPGRWATIEFNNSDGKVFDIIKDGIRTAGFEIVNMLLLDKKQKSFKQHQGADGSQDVVDKDVFFNVQKPAVTQATVSPEDYDLERQLSDAVRQYLETLPARIKGDPARYNDEHRTTATINSMLMNVLIPRGVNVERLNLPFIERVCGRYFRKVGRRWYLRGEAATGSASEPLFSGAVSVVDELTAIDWLRHELQAKPMLLGELKPLWMRATGLLSADVSQLLVLEDLLTENFWRDATSNRWREPTLEERARMNDDRSLRVLHDAERFVNNALRRDTTDDERCEWIDVLFQACRAIENNEMDALPALRGFDKVEAYGLIPRLFQSVLRDHASPEAFARAEKQGRAASQRVARQAEDVQPSKAHVGQRTDQSKLDFES